MTALTTPHDRLDDCAALRRLVATTWRKVQAGAPWRRAGAAAGLVGGIRALEVTHGGNGWHPHLHLLLFFEPGAGQLAIETFGIWLFERWARFIAKAGQGVCNPAIFRFERAASAEAAGDYVAKWGVEDELVRGHTKKSKHGRTPWMLLEAFAGGDTYAGALFRDYAYAFKGARQLTWSKGLRERFGLRDVDDGELVEAEEVETVCLGAFSAGVFHTLRGAGLALALLDAVEAAPKWETVAAFLKEHRISDSAWHRL